MEMAGRHANLRALLADDEDCRNAVLEMVTTMETINNEDTRGFHLASMLDPALPDYAINSKMKPYQLQDEPLRLLQDVITFTRPNARLPMHNAALSVEEISLRGVCYTTSRSVNFRSSRVLFNSPDGQPTREYIPGAIRDIVQYTYEDGEEEQKEFFLLVQEYPLMDTSDGQTDPYRKFGFAGGFLCLPNAEKMHVLRLSQVVSHFGLTKMRGAYKNFIHCMPVDRVSVLFLMLQFSLI